MLQQTVLGVGQQIAGLGEELLHVAEKGQGVALQGGARLVMPAGVHVFLDGVGRGMQLGVHVLHLGEDGAHVGNFLFQLLTLRTVEPFPEVALTAVSGHAQGDLALLQHEVLHIHRPLQVSDFRRQKGAVLGGLAEDLGILVDDVEIEQHGSHRYEEEENESAECGIQLFADGNVNPTHGILQFTTMTAGALSHKCLEGTFDNYTLYRPPARVLYGCGGFFVALSFV